MQVYRTLNPVHSKETPLSSLLENQWQGFISKSWGKDLYIVKCVKNTTGVSIKIKRIKNSA